MRPTARTTRAAAQRFPGPSLLGPFALAAFGAAALFGIHARAGAEAADAQAEHAAEPARAAVPAPCAPERTRSPSGRRRATVTDPLWDNAVWYPGSLAPAGEPPLPAPGGDAFHP